MLANCAIHVYFPTRSTPAWQWGRELPELQLLHSPGQPTPPRLALGHPGQAIPPSLGGCGGAGAALAVPLLPTAAGSWDRAMPRAFPRLHSVAGCFRVPVTWGWLDFMKSAAKGRSNMLSEFPWYPQS